MRLYLMGPTPLKMIWPSTHCPQFVFLVQTLTARHSSAVLMHGLPHPCWR